MKNKIINKQKRSKEMRREARNNIKREKRDNEIKKIKKKAISIFEILTLIIASFAFAYLISELPKVSAQTTQVQLPIYKCCKETKSGELCEDIPDTTCGNECKESCQPSTCEQFIECKLGCCYDENQGTCANNAPKAECEASGGKWTDNSACNLVECKRGCCILGDKTEFITEKNCQVKSVNFGVEKDFRQLNEIECYALKGQQIKGACVSAGENSEENLCKFTTEYECNKIFNSIFYENYLCTNPELNTSCQRSKQTTCVEGKDEVYYVDSCGNIANVYDANKLNEQSYWNFIANYSEICGFDDDKASANSKTCGNCNHLLSSTCRQYSAETAKPRYGNYICKDLSCNYEGKKYRHGESWCVYDRCIGDGSDAVGSRHWKYSCIEGEVRSEPCADYRNEICAESIITNDEGQKFSIAGCRVNNWQECLDGTGCKNGNPDCSSQELNILTEGEYYLDCGKGVESHKDCSDGKEVGWGTVNDWLDEPVKTDEVIVDSCYPKFPPGFDVTTYEGYTAAKTICGSVAFECPVQFVRIKKKKLKPSIVGIIPAGWETIWEKWFCLRNCKCLDVSFVKKLHHQACIKMGDCGSKGNYIGINQKTGYLLENSDDFANYQRFVDTSDGAGAFCPPGLTIHEKPSTEVLDFLMPEPEEEAEETGEPRAPSGISVREEGMPSWLEGTSGVGGLVLAAQISGYELVVGSALLANFANALGTVAIGAFIGNMFAKAFGFDAKATKTLTIAGAIAGLIMAILTLIPDLLPFGPFSPWTFVIIIIVIIIVSYFVPSYEKTGEETVTAKFECLPFEPVSGGGNCDECNKDLLKPCSKYRCSSLGAACELINEGTGNELCVAKSKDDKKAPAISPWTDAALGEIIYSDIKNNGFSVRENTGDCIPSWTAIRFGIKTNEAAICKVDSFHRANFDEMSFYFGSNNMFKYNHDMSIVMPAIESLNINASNEINYYIRCKDRFGNKNTDEYTINLCVKKGQDNSAPQILKTEPKNSGYLKYQAKETNLTIWVNEPANCKFSKDDKSYENMENLMNCVKDINLAKGIITDDGSASWGLPCQTKLSNLTLDNNFYFRCKDQPWLNESDAERNTMQDSYLYNIKVSSSELNVTITEPENGKEIIAATSPVTLTLRAETSGGAIGKATCKYSFNSYENATIFFYNTYDTIHSQIFNSMTKGKYTIYVVCEDEAGNIAQAKTKFKITIDDKSPKVTRIYHQAGSLVIMTSENAECKYNPVKCNFNYENGTLMSTGDGIKHEANWNPAATYYIKCKDSFGNLPSGCSAIVRPYDLV